MVLHFAAPMDRITINLDRPVGRKLRAKAKADRRSVSDYVCLLVERDLGFGGADEVRRLSQELRRLGGAPEQILRNAIAAMEDPVVAPISR